MPIINLAITRDEISALTMQDAGGAFRIQTGSINDNLAYTLNFARDDTDLDKQLILYLGSYREVLGTANVYTMPDALTKYEKIEIVAAYVVDSVEMEHTNIVTLRFRDNISPGLEPPPDPLPDPIIEVLARSPVDARLSDDETKIEFINRAGGVTFDLPSFLGPEGPQGPTGPQGEQGEIGASGSQGPKGDTGIQGTQGPQGVQGEPGAKGDTGAVGAQGPEGDTGAQGPKGDTGLTGPKGDAGPQGVQGPVGPQGPQGDPATGSITSTTITANEVLTQAQYDALKTSGQLNPTTAYDIIEVSP